MAEGVRLSEDVACFAGLPASQQATAEYCSSKATRRVFAARSIILQVFL